MKKLLICAFAASLICCTFAACKTNTSNEPQNSNARLESSLNSDGYVSGVPEASTLNSHVEEAPNGIVTDRNGIIGDADNDNMLSDVVSDVASGVENITDHPLRDTGETIHNVTSDIVSGTESIVDNAADGARNAVSDVVSGTESTVERITSTTESTVNSNRNER